MYIEKGSRKMLMKLQKFVQVRINIKRNLILRVHHASTQGTPNSFLSYQKPTPH